MSTKVKKPREPIADGVAYLKVPIRSSDLQEFRDRCADSGDRPEDVVYAFVLAVNSGKIKAVRRKTAPFS